MTGRIVTWDPQMTSLGSAVIAIGVFDGVHVGHQQLLRDAVAEAVRLGVQSVALTFDRDPDQVVLPEAAAPQLLTLEDKCRFILDCGIETVLVVPFTEDIAHTPAEKFLDDVLGACCSVVTIHVGADFHFGAKAAGDVGSLRSWVGSRGARVRPHQLLEYQGEPVSSTRIRQLVSDGEVAEAAILLGRPTRIAGMVHLGRRQGRELGFPTANILPAPYAAIPGDGVYAGRVHLDDGSVHPAAVSAGLPPTFPEARDYVEAHLIDFEGDLYDRQVTVEFLEKLRDQRAFASLEELSAAIAADVATASLIAARAATPEVSDGKSESSGSEDLAPGESPFEINPAIDITYKVAHMVGLDLEPDPYFLEDGRPVIEDPAALARATAAAGGMRSDLDQSDSDEEWVELVERRRLSGLFGEAGYTAALVTAPLQAAGIPFRWDPYPPSQMPSFRVGYGAIDRPFSLLVPASRREEALQIMDLHAFSVQTAPPTSDVLIPPRPRSVSQPVPPTDSRQHPELKSGRVDRARMVQRALIWLVLIMMFMAYVFSRR